MENLITVIGSIASIGGLPLAIYLFIKSKEQKFDKIKRGIIQTLSFQIGEERDISRFEIQTVINSKLKENRINTNKISVKELIEDLVVTVMSSPLLDKERKTTVINSLKYLYFNNTFHQSLLDLITLNLPDDKLKEKIDLLINESKKKSSKENYLQQESKGKKSISSLFGLITIISILITLITYIVGAEKYNELFSPNDPENILFGYKANLIIGIVISVVSVSFTIFINKIKQK
ncbi:hypothetical protein [Kordia sp.]|uniref:hypothetical protein n=1 Tax=Kordia sp. TaxID=1965332 RepID=UPI003B594EDA